MGLWSSFAVAAVATGHAGSIDVIVTPPIVRPGEVVAVQSGVLWTEIPIDADLVHPDGRTSRLGSGATAPDGSLDVAFTLPTDIPDARYEVLITNQAGETAHGYVVVRSDVAVLPLLLGIGAAIGVLLIGVRLLARRRTPRSAEPEAPPGP